MEKSALIILFGATGDLAQRKLYPSLFRLFQKKELNQHFAVIGTARRPWTDEHFRQVISESLGDIGEKAEVDEFAQHFYYQSHNVNDSEHYVTLKKLAEKLNQQYQCDSNYLYYLAMAPQFFGTITQHLKSEEILAPGFNRLVIEKPFGTDLKSAEQLNEEIRAVFPEKEIFRIDHYLGKEMIQNIAAVRFANPLFEKLWNRDSIENVQITFAEELGVENRGNYYEHAGALKDMVQNHVLQVLALLAMEVPTRFAPEEIRAEKVKVLSAVKILEPKEVAEDFVFGQYDSGHLGDNQFLAYRQEENVAPDSQTETFVAGKFSIDNYRWAGVPFYIRTGKRLTERGTRINIVFKNLPVDLFQTTAGLGQNILTIYIQPTEGFSLLMNGKEIGPEYLIRPIKLDYRNSEELTSNSPEAYEKLLLDALNGDSMNFTHWDEVAQSWRIVDAIKEGFIENNCPVNLYPARAMGPEASFELLEKDGHQWIWQPEQWYQERNLL
ncbi:glucose-6-phosphate dehydrogenase [Enterococcus timonensis]|uniref:glucose-6-phosphate dehydrogenase n=1 Tax=Enterococcus timonensis TaxID=1852364 RepID=UPI0008DA3554|nr:glucose-6-phosphate dehydrogenase [Enterococcus timonensis]